MEHVCQGLHVHVHVMTGTPLNMYMLYFLCSMAPRFREDPDIASIFTVCNYEGHRQKYIFLMSDK